MTYKRIYTYQTQCDSSSQALEPGGETPVCVCVCKKERERKREIEYERETIFECVLCVKMYVWDNVWYQVRHRVVRCACVCMCVRPRVCVFNLIANPYTIQPQQHIIKPTNITTIITITITTIIIIITTTIIIVTTIIMGCDLSRLSCVMESLTCGNESLLINSLSTASFESKTRSGPPLKNTATCTKSLLPLHLKKKKRAKQPKQKNDKYK